MKGVPNKSGYAKLLRVVAQSINTYTEFVTGVTRILGSVAHPNGTDKMDLCYIL